MKKLILVTGISGVGKTTIAQKIYQYYSVATLIPLDSLKEPVYELIGYSNASEKGKLEDLVYQLFRDLVETCMQRQDNMIIVEYPFAIHWFSFFQSLVEKYQYQAVTIHVTGGNYDAVWQRLDRRNNSTARHPSHSLDCYNPKEKNQYRSFNELDYQELKKDYEENKYTKIAIGTVIDYENEPVRNLTELLKQIDEVFCNDQR